MNVCPLYDSFNFHEAGKSAFNWASALLLRPQHSTDLQPEILRQQILGVFGRGQPGPIFVDVKYIEKYVKVEIQKKMMMIPPSQQIVEVRSSPSRDAIARHHQDAFFEKSPKKSRPAWGGFLSKV